MIALKIIGLILLLLAAACHGLKSFGVPAGVDWAELGWCLALLGAVALLV